MNNKIAIVTGATGAIGKAIANQIADHNDFEVVLACRNEKKAKQAVSEIIGISGNNNVRYEIVDLSIHKSIKEFADRWEAPLHVLVNNAAVTPVNREESGEGIEMQFATNVLGYFRMIQEFKEHLIASAPSRIVNVASYWAGDLLMDDLEFLKRRYNNNEAYRQSKQADRMLTVSFAEKLKNFRITVNACHPGDVNSKLSNNLGFGGSEIPDEGAKTPVWLATNIIGEETTGKYFERMREEDCRFVKDKAALDTLYNICESY